MTILNLTEDFISLCSQERGCEEYEKLYPALFEHYFSYWCLRPWEGAVFNKEQIRERARRVASAIEFTEAALSKWSGGAQGVQDRVRDMVVVMFVGANTSNGHAFFDGERWVVWIPVETYTTDALARIFITHEFVHALHYKLTPEFYFDDHVAKNHIGRQLITEGVATFLTSEILGVSDREALWADYLSTERAEAWMSECRRRHPELRDIFRRNFSESIPGCQLFMANDPGDIVSFRAGYFAGLELVRDVTNREKLRPVDLLTLERDRFETLALAELEGPLRA